MEFQAPGALAPGTLLASLPGRATAFALVLRGELEGVKGGARGPNSSRILPRSGINNLHHLIEVSGYRRGNTERTFFGPSFWRWEEIGR